MNKKILVIAAHPDDEILGAGATLINLVKAGNNVSCLILGQGAMARDAAKTKNIDSLKKDALESGKIIGFDQIYFSDLPDNQFDKLPLLEIVKEVEKYFEIVGPDIIYTHYENDLNVDHQLTAQAVMTAARPCNPDAPSEIYAFETLSSTEWQSKVSNIFNPSIYINIEDSIDLKIKAMKAYTSEIREYPHSRSIEGIKILAQYRGLEAGLKYAEAFILVRKIEK